MWLGHDGPQYPAGNLKNIWHRTLFHCKNAGALRALKGFHCFAHEEDRFTLTTDGKIWIGETLIEPCAKSIVPLITKEEVEAYPYRGMYGVCSDFPVEARERFK